MRNWTNRLFDKFRITDIPASGRPFVSEEGAGGTLNGDSLLNRLSIFFSSPAGIYRVL